MSRDEHIKLQQLRATLRGTRYFAFEKGGKFLLYREGERGSKNTWVTVSADIARFMKEAATAAGVAL